MFRMTPAVLKHLLSHSGHSSIIEIQCSFSSGSSANSLPAGVEGGNLCILMTLMSSNPIEQAVPFTKNIIFLSCLSGSLH